MSDNLRAEKTSQLQDCSDLQYVLIGDLRDVLEEAPSKQSRRWLLAVLDALLKTLPTEKALKSQDDGYLAEVLEEYPNWAGKVNRLEIEQLDLQRNLHELREQLSCHATYRSIARRLQTSLSDWMDAFVAHQKKESELLLNAMNLDVGSGD